jgi:hypothetical protein
MPNSSVLESKLGAFPLATYETGETVPAAGSRTIQAAQSCTEINNTTENIGGLLGSNGASLVYAGYPYDPYA